VHVVYPCVDVSSNKKDVIQDAEPEFLASDGRKILLSINKFEQKNIELAIKAFAHLTDQERKSSRLIIAGMLHF
jgi:alpha-1,3/alpha-1,6-mannosyltransferase